MPLLDDFEPSGLSAFGQNVSSKRRGAIGAGLESGYEDIKGLGYNALAAGADVVGASEARDWLEKKAKEKEYASFVASRPELERVEDQNLSTALPFAGYQVAKQIPNLVGAVGMGVLAPEVAVPSALARGGALLPRALGGGGFATAEGYAARKAAVEAGQTFGKQVVGGAAFNEAQAVGSLYQSAREGGDQHAGRTALLASPAYALSETLPEAMMVGRLAHGSGFSGNLLSRMTKSGLTQAGTGATSELLQTGMEQAVGKALTPEESRSQYLNAGVVGGLVEGLLGTTGGFRAKSSLLPTGNAPTAAPPGNAPSNDVAQTFAQNDRTTPDSSMAGLTGRGKAGRVDPLAGRSKLIPSVIGPTAVPKPEVPELNPLAARTPAVAGGTTDVAQQTQAQFMQQQQAQQEQANQTARDKTFQTLGAQYSPENGGALNIFGAQLFGDAKINAFGNTLAAKLNALPPVAHQIADAVAQAHELTGKLVPLTLDGGNPIGSADKVMKALAKTTDKFQIGHVQSIEQAANILESLSKTAKGNDLDQGNAIYYALTGKETSGYIASQQSKAAKGAKNGKLQLQNNAGLGTVPVQGGTREGGGGNLGNVQPSGVQSLLTGSQPQGPISQQIGQPSGEGIRTGTSVTPNLSSGQLTSGQVNVQATNQNGGGQVSGQPQQAAPSAVGERPVQNGPRIYATPPQYYATDLSHIKGSRRIEVILDLLNKALAPKVTRKGVAQSAERVEMLRLALLEQFESKEIAKLTGMTEATVQKQLERLGVNFDREKGQWGVTDLEFAKTLVDTAMAYRSVEFPDGIGEQELAALYSTKYTAEDTAENQLEPDLLGEEVKPESSKLQEELGTKEKPEAQSMGVVDTYGGSQGAVDTSGDAFFAKVGKLQAQLELASDAEKPAIQKKIDAAWAEYGKDQTKRGKTGEIEVKPSNEGEEDAIQEQGADEGDVRKPTGGGEEVGKTNAKPKKSAGTRKAKVEVKPAEKAKQEVATVETKREVKTPEEQWKALADQFPGMPPYEGLTKDEKIRWDDVASRGVANLAAADKILNTVVKAGTPQAPSATGTSEEIEGKFGKDGAVTEPYSVAELTKEISDFVRTAINTRKLKIVGSVKDLLMSADPVEQKLGAVLALNRAYGVATNGRAYLIADRISKGQGRAKFMHEVGVHLGVEGLLPDQQFDTLTDQIFTWAKRDDDSREAKLAKKAILRAETAGTPDEDLRSEILAYFVEEAMQDGINPSAAEKLSGPLGSWFRTLWAAFKTAIRRLGMNPEKMNAQDVVNIAYGAARLEMSGTYHGTAADFRRFNHKYMGSGEGAQAYGWGTYLAQRFGIAKGYWKADIERKTQPKDDIATAFFEAGIDSSKINNVYYNEADEPFVISNNKKLKIRKLSAGDDRIGIPVTFTSGRLKGLPDYRSIDTLYDKSGGRAFSDQEVAAIAAVLNSATVPKGNVMRVDVGVDQNELLNWDSKLSKQPELLAKLEANIPEGLKQSLVDETNLDLNEMTGEDLYRGLEFLEKKEGRVSEEFDVDDYNKRLANKKAKELVSVYLDEVVGIPGLKFYDAESRGKPENQIVFKGKKYTREDLINLKDELGPIPLNQITILRHVLRNGYAETIKELEQKLERNIKSSMEVTKETYAKFNFPYVEDKARKDAERIHEKSYEGEQIKFLKDNKDNISIVKDQNVRTRNLVIFNDKNIFRVGSRGGNERANMKFGKDQAINGLPPKIKTPVKTVVDTLLDSGKATMINRNEDVKHLLLAAGITEDVVNGATKYMPSAQEYLANQYERQGTRIEHEQRIQKIEEAFEKLPTELQGTGANSVNAFIYDSTTERKWGYTPSYNPNVKVDPAMKAKFDAMPAAAQNVIRMVFDHGYQSLRLKQQAVKAAADKEFSQREQDANGDQEQLNNIAADRRGWEAKYDRLMNIKNDMPYAYLGRYGDYVAVAKSETYVDAEALSAKGDLDATKWLEENQSDGNHYIVEFAETMAEAKTKADEWKASGKYKHVYGAEKEVSEAFVGGSDLFMGITRLRNMLTRRIKSGEMTVGDQETLDALHKTVSDLYLATVSEASAHRTAMQRKNITGADKDMMRNLATRGRADAHFLASLKHNEDITDSISAMRDEAKADPSNARPYLNELLKRYARDINYKTPAPWARTLTRLGHTWFLSFNPAFYLQQTLQTYVLSLPYLAGRLGYFRSLRSINNAYKDVLGLVKDTNVNEHLDFSKAPADVRDMLQKLVRMGKIDIGIDADAVVYANERTVTSSVMRKLNGINNRIEAINRSTAAIAAYRGYIQRYGVANAEAAVKFASDTVSNTHGSYDGFNTPRILNSNVGKVLGQFKRFQIIQLSMLGKLFKQSFGNASAQEKLVARRTLGFIGGHMAVLGGALGVPFVSQIAYLTSKLAGLFSDDEPEDYEYQLRQAIGDPTLANLLLRGVPAVFGLESLGKKLAMENVAAILPFTDIDMTSRSGAEKMLIGLMGPTAALSLKAADALGMIGKGEYYKGLELALPNGLGNAMKGYRFATEGITMRNGDLVLNPEEISYIDAAFQAVGLPTNTITHRQYTQKVEAEFDKYYSDRASEIKGEYVNASRKGDSEGMSAARQDWENLQDSRRKNGYKIQPMSELFKSLVAARKREASVVNGVETTKANKKFVANII